MKHPARVTPAVARAFAFQGGNMQTAELPSIDLWFREGSSDKIYRAAVEAKDGGFVVTFAYGRRGAQRV